jgi:DNA-binding SARP family transcriptional activator
MLLFKAWLFGKPEFRYGACPTYCELPQKAEQLLCYLLSNRGRKHHREQLIETLWQDSAAELGKPYFRKALWQLQTSLKKLGIEPTRGLLEIDNEWLRINTAANLWVDIYAFEQSYNRTRDLRGSQLSLRQYQDLCAAAALYRGEFLENLYQDWCIVERERYKEMFLLMLDKMMGYCEKHRQFDTGIAYGQTILSFDCAHEQTHYRLMRLKYLAGNRTGALRQFETCRKALRKELNVEPAERTQTLLDRIASDLPLSGQSSLDTKLEENLGSQALCALQRINELQIAQSALQTELKHEVEALETLLTAQAQNPPRS